MRPKKLSQVTSSLTLREAQKAGKIEEFVDSHQADPDGDLDKLDAVIKRPTQGSGKATRPASSQGASDD